MFKHRFKIAVTVLALLVSAGAVSARQFLQADRCEIAAGETVNGTLFVFCQNLIISGTVDGNLIGAATTTTIDGTVTNGVYLFGAQLDLYGTLAEDLHYFGAALNIHDGTHFQNRVTDLFYITMSTTIDPEVTLPGSIVAAGYQTLVHGDVGKEIDFWGSALEVGGGVAGDVFAAVGDADDTEGTTQLETLFIPFPVELDLVNPGLRLSESASIGGDLRYSAPTPGTIDGKVTGVQVFDQVSNQFEPPTDEESLRQSIQAYFGAGFREFVTLGVVGGLGLIFVPGLMQLPIRNLRRRPLTSLGVGTLTFILSFPLFAIGLLVSMLVLFILSLLQAGNLIFAGLVGLLVLNVGGASLFYLVAIFVARSVFCLAIGRWLLRFVFKDDNTPHYLYFSLGAGAFLTAFAVSLPLIGWIFNALALFLGLGAIINLIQAELRIWREADYAGGTHPTSNGIRPGRRYDIDIAPPALPGELPPQPRPRHTVGIDDLPPGFVWWDEL